MIFQRTRAGTPAAAVPFSRPQSFGEKKNEIANGGGNERANDDEINSGMRHKSC